MDSNEMMNQLEQNDEVLKGDEVISKIYQILKIIEDKVVSEWKTDMLVDYVYSLCKLMYNLGDMKDDAYAIAEVLEEEYDALVRDEYIKLKTGTEKISDKLAEAMAEARHTEEKAGVILANATARKLKGLYTNCDRQINFTQTKVKSVVDSKIRTNIPTN